MTRALTEVEAGWSKGWDLDVLLLESGLLGGLGFAGLSSLLEGWLSYPVAQVGGFLLLMLTVFPAVKVGARRRGGRVSASRFLALTLLGAVIGAAVLVVIHRLT
jgi:hypothetical protein